MNKVLKKYLLPLIIAAVLVIIDQITKSLAVKFLSDGPRNIIPGVISFTLLQGGNRGAAFGMLQGGFWFFMITTFVVIAVLLWLLFKIPDSKKFLILRITLSLILAGAIGNCIDRIVSKASTGISSVVDFIYIDLINFPIFNVADICVSIGAVLLIVLGLFVYKEDDFKEIIKKNE